MGLDAWAHAVKGDPVEKDGYLEWPEKIEISYWRKHPNLEGYMANLWHDKGHDDEFNCQELELTLEDLQALEESINGKMLPCTVGFFFGGDSDEFYKEQDLEFVRDARSYINDGYTVIYSSWW
jgi:hypothetical protein